MRMPAKETPRFTVVDMLASQNLDLIPRNSRRRRERYVVIDNNPGPDGDREYDVFSTKGTATRTARDLNRGVYGPLADAS